RSPPHPGGGGGGRPRPPPPPLPPIRQLARDLGLAAGTVARAYRELEAAGILETGRRRGTRVAAAPQPPGPADPLAAAAQEFVRTARELNADVGTALAAVQNAFREGR
ncbi:GntR family transcriptional regulator, partial [Saccharopolyspora sp. NPDC002686]|uniref:GntR family transcriptional regulator n=1 Tax=Saccharopolyspora sp. NPDC002686 TaxID=3154541 RepID=UPI00331F7E9F